MTDNERTSETAVLIEWEFDTNDPVVFTSYYPRLPAAEPTDGPTYTYRVTQVTRTTEPPDQ